MKLTDWNLNFNKPSNNTFTLLVSLFLFAFVGLWDSTISVGGEGGVKLFQWGGKAE
jgi:hypothetical protein